MLNIGIECRPGFYSLNLMKPYKKFVKGNYPVSNKLSDISISLPTTNVKVEDQRYIIKNLLLELKEIN